MKKQLAAIGVTTAVIGLGITGFGIANAATPANGQPKDGALVQAIADKFKLNKTDVQAVFDEQHAKMQNDREADLKNRQAQLVKDGKLTQKQSDAITDKRAELQKERSAFRADMQSKTADERKTEMEKRHTELDNWFKDQGIDSKYRYLLMGGRSHGGAGGEGHRGGMHANPNQPGAPVSDMR